MRLNETQDGHGSIALRMTWVSRRLFQQRSHNCRRLLSQTNSASWPKRSDDVHALS